MHYYAALTELALGDKAKALVHGRRAKQLGYSEVLLRASPELGEIRSMI